MSRIATDQPPLASISAVARPMPRGDAAPVSTAVRSAGKVSWWVMTVSLSSPGCPVPALKFASAPDVELVSGHGFLAHRGGRARLDVSLRALPGVKERGYGRDAEAGCQ